MKFDGEVIKFNIFDAMRFPAEVNYVHALDVIDELSQDIYDLSHEDELFTVLTKSLDHAEFQRVPYQVNNNLVDVIGSLFHLQVHNRPDKLELPKNLAKLLPSRISPPKLELKPLLDNLKYAYLGVMGICLSSSLVHLPLIKKKNLLRCLENIAKQ